MSFEGMNDEQIALLAVEDEKAADFLLVKYKPLVRARASTYYLIGGDRDDLIQEGMLGLFKAIRDYQPGKSNFLAFADLCITRQILSAVKAATRKKHGPLNSALSLQSAMEEGSRYIEAIRRANDAIPGEEISEKLYRLEALIKKIFEVLKQKPEQLPKLRKFMQYYMPTTLKLVQTYQELDAQPTEGENIRQSKAEIEKTLDTINLAYEKLLDSFFEDAAMDIRSDITVLETMLAQEGLTEDEIRK